MQKEGLEQDVYYHISTMASLLGLSTRTILKYERLGLIQCESVVIQGGIRHRCYRPETLDRLRRIKWLMTDLGVNLAGVEIILQLLDRLEGHDQGI
ncbi:MAG: MerR family transcriptional regulator [Nitrospira sp.]|nr:MerR family transcriptional regulator [Nitrospira sp.]